MEKTRAVTGDTDTQPGTIIAAIERATFTPKITIESGFYGRHTVLERDHLVERSLAVAHRMRAQGVARGDVVAIALPTCAEFLFTLLGAWLCGAAVAPVSIGGFGGRRDVYGRHLRAVAENIRPRLLIGRAETLSPARENAMLREWTRVIDVQEWLAGPAPPSGELVAPEPEDLALVQVSSESLESAGGVMLTHGQIVANIAAIGRRLAVDASEDRMVSWLPLFHDMGLIGGLCSALYWGLDLTLIPTESFIADPLRWLQAMSRTRATISPTPAFALGFVATRTPQRRSQRLDLSSWRSAPVGAEPVFRRALEAFARKLEPVGLRPTTLQPSYGVAEATMAVTMSDPNEGARYDWVSRHALREGVAYSVRRDDPAAVAVTSVGCAVGDTELRIVDAQGDALAERHAGRILIRGSSVASAYMRKDRRVEPIETWLDTGDLGYLDGGHLFVTGRARDQVVRYGRSVPSRELERAAATLPQVSADAVAAFSIIDHARSSEEIVVVVEPQDGALPRFEQDLRSAVASLTGVRVDVVRQAAPGSIPRMANGKLARSQCRELFMTGSL